MIPGIDVSHYQGVIRWDRVKDAGIQFAYIKATDGASFTDSCLKWNWAQSKAAGVPRGAYHFYRPGVNVASQGTRFMDSILPDGELPPALDLEVGPMDEVELADVLTLLTWLEDHFQRIPVLYVDLATASKITDDRFARFPLWLADYSGVSTVPGSMILTEWTFWQHTPAGKVDGVPSQVDLDWFSGTADELANVGKLAT